MSERSHGASTWSVLALLVCGVLAVSLITAGLASLKVSQTREGWRRTFGTDEEIRARLFVDGPNAAALELERLAAGLGVSIVPRGDLDDTTRTLPEQSVERAFVSVKPAMRNYIHAQLQRVDAGVDPPPNAVSEWFVANSAGLDAVRSVLLRNVPHWGLEVAANPWETPIPNMLGHLDLQRVLIVDALAALAAGEREPALESLEAGWNLTGSVRDDPVIICQLIGFIETRMHVGLLRRIESPPEVWAARLRDLRLRDTFVDALRYDGWAWSTLKAADLQFNSTRPVRNFFLRLVPAYGRYCVADLSDDYRRTLDSIDFDAPLCDAGLDGADVDLNFPIPEWNLLGEGYLPHLNGAVGRMARLELDIDLTLQVLDPPFADTPSTSCPRDTWLVESSADGGFEISLDRNRAWPDQKGLVLPTRFVRRSS